MGCWTSGHGYGHLGCWVGIDGLLGGNGYLDGILMALIRIRLLGGHGHEHGLLGGYGHGLLGGYGHLDRIFNGFN